MSEHPQPPNPVVTEALRQAIHQALPTPSRREYSALLMLSGGLDSVALLVNLLTATDQHLHVHHIDLHNSEKRCQAESEALVRILPYCRERYRPFTYSTSRSDFPLGRGGGYDLTLILFTAARVHTALGSVIDIVYTGHVAPSAAEILEGAAVLHACYVNKRFRPLWLRPLAHLRKLDIYTSIPSELADMTWSCRTPIYEGESYRPCGRCHACRSRAEVAAELHEGGPAP